MLFRSPRFLTLGINMPTFRITWEIDIDAPTARDAVLLARKYQLDSESAATVFNVRRHEPRGKFGPPTRWDVEGICPYCRRRTAHLTTCERAPSDPSTIDLSTREVR